MRSPEVQGMSWEVDDDIYSFLCGHCRSIGDDETSEPAPAEVPAAASGDALAGTGSSVSASRCTGSAFKLGTGSSSLPPLCSPFQESTESGYGSPSSLPALQTPETSGTESSGPPRLWPSSLPTLRTPVSQSARNGGDDDVDTLLKTGVQHFLEDRIENIEHIGSGGNGSLSKVQILGETFALKIPSRMNEDDSSFCRNQILQELSNVLSCKTIPGIVRATGVVLDGRRRCVGFLMQFFEGGSLHDLLRKGGGMSLSQFKITAIILAKTLQEFHRHGHVHGDLKPANILLGENGTPIIGDLGSAIVKDGILASTSRYRTGVTDLYMAPELYYSETSLSDKSDIFSFGIILQEMMTGLVRSKDRDNIGYDHKRGSVNLPKALPSWTCPKEWTELVRDCLSLEPEKRPRAGGIVEVLEGK